MTPSRPVPNGGQAAVEAVALAALLALLLGIVAVWAVRALPGGVTPPPLVERAAAPLAPAPGPAPVRPAPRAGGEGGGTTLWRRVVRGGRSLLLLRIEAELAFDRAFARRLRERVGAAARDPRALLAGRDGPGRAEGAGGARGRLRRARDYVGRLRAMPRRAAVLQVSEDLGDLAADRGLDLVTRRGLRRVLGRILVGRTAAGERPAP